MLAGVIKAV